MRLAGIIDTPEKAGVHDHVGWVFDKPADFQVRAGRFLSAGLARRQRVVYVAGTDGDGPAEMPGWDEALASGQAELTSVRTVYSAGEPVDPERQVAAFVGAAERALQDGWSGLRVAADVTSLVLTEQQRAAWTRYELLIDAHMAHHPMTGMCGFHRTALEPSGLAAATCIHPALSEDTSAFRLYAGGHPDAHIVVAGEIDPENRLLFATTLRHARPEPLDGRLLVDASPLTFVDYRGLVELANYVADRGATAVLYADEASIAAMITRVVPLKGLQVLVRP
ncbi:hypothetical protein ACWT_3390 [Actinoplanes sp. SE50]|uniref:MEDS domain-containing protein n=1 Tax=unclassified Actinoplanes TaxID=2626549 RepID=UPI00023ED237|nr:MULTISPECIES: MEDS domain-containing protein [unclassified Actinoplanes]AEV84413.1 hypothetical protein ACPL_3518 [Actinoplanes sp. SE50/110]ATO82805.1 hypothetical protein ACWT_3390 [Actinoplanes sp. SE50]SLM00213.1 hypothetical protein ACSP50_3445 [Actinoplanes sp. SE50/110]